MRKGNTDQPEQSRPSDDEIQRAEEFIAAAWDRGKEIISGGPKNIAELDAFIESFGRAKNVLKRAARKLPPEE